MSTAKMTKLNHVDIGKFTQKLGTVNKTYI